LFELVQYYEQLTRFEGLVRDIDEPALLGAYYGSMAMCEGSFGDFERAIGRAQRAVELCQAGGDVQYLTQAYAAWLWSNVHVGDFQSVLAVGANLRRAAEPRSGFRWYAYGLGAMTAAAACLGEFARAAESFATQYETAAELGDRSTMSHALWTMSWAFLYKEDMPRALETGRRAVDLAPTMADRSWAEASLGMVYCRAGEYGKAVEILAPLVPVYRAARFRMSEVFTAFLGEAYWRAGRVDLARQTLQELLEVIGPCGMRGWMGIAHRVLGEIESEEDVPAASIHFERSLTFLAETNARPELALTLASYGRFHRQQSKTADAQRCFEQALAMFEELGTLVEPDRVRAELAGLHGGRP
jgi:tetratricopeptide (TPR) repeat protein